MTLEHVRSWYVICKYIHQHHMTSKLIEVTTGNFSVLMKRRHDSSDSYKFCVTTNKTVSQKDWYFIYLCINVLMPVIDWIQTRNDAMIYCKQTAVLWVCSEFTRWKEAGWKFLYITGFYTLFWTRAISCSVFFLFLFFLWWRHNYKMRLWPYQITITNQLRLLVVIIQTLASTQTLCQTYLL